MIVASRHRLYTTTWLRLELLDCQKLWAVDLSHCLSFSLAVLDGSTLVLTTRRDEYRPSREWHAPKPLTQYCKGRGASPRSTTLLNYLPLT